MTRQDIIDKVLVRMKEVTPFDEGIVILSPEVETILNYIEGYLQASCDELLMICPLSLTIPVSFPTSGIPLTLTGFTSVTDNGKKIGTLTIPSDFLRLHTFKISSWERPVHRPISIDNPQYEFQFNPFTRGGNAKPVIVKNKDLKIFTFDIDATPEIYTYVPKINLDDIKLNEKLVDPLVCLISANVYSQYGHPQSKVMMDQLKTLLAVENGN